MFLDTPDSLIVFDRKRHTDVYKPKNKRKGKHSSVKKKHINKIYKSCIIITANSYCCQIMRSTLFRINEKLMNFVLNYNKLLNNFNFFLLLMLEFHEALFLFTLPNVLIFIVFITIFRPLYLIVINFII